MSDWQLVQKRVEAMHNSASDLISSLASQNELTPQLATMLTGHIKELFGLLVALQGARRDARLLDRILDTLARIGPAILMYLGRQ